MTIRVVTQSSPVLMQYENATFRRFLWGQAGPPPGLAGAASSAAAKNAPQLKQRKPSTATVVGLLPPAGRSSAPAVPAAALSGGRPGPAPAGPGAGGIHDPSVVFEQLTIIFALPRMFVGSFTLVLPFFPTGTSERIDSEGEVPTAVTLSRMLSHIPLSRGGPSGLVIYDIHALQERFYFGDNVLPLFESGIPLLKRELSAQPDSDDIVIAYPDEGAWKRFHMYFKGVPEVVCTKVRDGEKRIVRLKEGAPEGKHVVIVDDLVQSGGTLIECQKLLATHGAKHVSAYVTHGVFPNESYQRFVPDGGAGAAAGFRFFWLTDSCPQTAKAVAARPPFKILSLAESIAAALEI